MRQILIYYWNLRNESKQEQKQQSLTMGPGLSWRPQQSSSSQGLRAHTQPLVTLDWLWPQALSTARTPSESWSTEDSWELHSQFSEIRNEVSQGSAEELRFCCRRLRLQQATTMAFCSRLFRSRSEKPPLGFPIYFSSHWPNVSPESA